MTICIAAACIDDDNNYRVILCADRRQSGMMGKSDHAMKIRFMRGGWHLLTAGDDDEINAMVLLMRDEMNRLVVEGPVGESDAHAATRAAITRRRREKAEEIVNGRFGISYDEFRRTGQQFLPDDDYRAAVRDISAPLRANFIVAGVPGGFPFLIETNVDGTTCVRDVFSVIGAGCYLAQSALLNRSYHDYLPMPQALYCVYEAKKYAEGEVSVGTTTSMMILSTEELPRVVTATGIEWLEAKYEEFGPRPIPRGVSYPPNFTTNLADDVAEPDASALPAQPL